MALGSSEPSVSLEPCGNLGLFSKEKTALKVFPLSRGKIPFVLPAKPIRFCSPGGEISSAATQEPRPAKVLKKYSPKKTPRYLQHPPSHGERIPPSHSQGCPLNPPKATGKNQQMLSHHPALWYHSVHPKKLELGWLSSVWEAGEDRRAWGKKKGAEFRWFWQPLYDFHHCYVFEDIFICIYSFFIVFLYFFFNFSLSQSPLLLFCFFLLLLHFAAVCRQLLSHGRIV